MANPFSAGYLGRFKGIVCADTTGNKTWAALDAARRAERHQSKDGDIQINVFADGSAERYFTANLPSHLSTNIRGGYAVVYNRMAPGTEQHGRIVQRGWHVFPAIDNNFCEGLAVTEAIQLSLREIRLAIMCEGITATAKGANTGALLTKGRPIKVKVFSDSQTFLNRVNKETLHFVDPSPAELRASGSSEFAPSISAQHFEANLKQKKGRLMDGLVELIIKGSEELQTIPGGFEVELELHWLPSHGTSVEPDERVRMHDLVDKIAAHSRKDREDFFQIDRRKITPEPGVFASLKSPLLVPPPGFLALFYPAQQDSSVTGATEETMAGVDLALISRHRELEEVRQRPGLVQREYDVARKEGHLDAREERLAEVRQGLSEEKDAIAQEKNALAEEKNVIADKRKVMYEEKKALGEERKVMAQKDKEQREADQELMARKRAVAKGEEALEAQRLHMEAQSWEMASREMQVAAREDELRIRQEEAQGRLYVFRPSAMFQLLTEPF